MQKIKKLFGILLTVVMVSMIGLNVLAQDEPVPTLFDENEEVTAEDLDIEEPTLLPDSRFYFLKNWGRSIRSFFTFDKVKKAELKLRYASAQILETDLMLKKNKKPELLEKAIAKYEESIEKVREIAGKIKDTASSSPKVGAFLDKLSKQSTLHQRILTKLENQVPTSTMARIRIAREAHIQKFGEVMDKLEDRSIQVQQRIQERVENKDQAKKNASSTNSTSTDSGEDEDEDKNGSSTDTINNSRNKDGTKWIRLDAIDVQAEPVN